VTNLYDLLLVIFKYTIRRQRVVYSDDLWSPQSKLVVLCLVPVAEQAIIWLDTILEPVVFSRK